MNTETDWRAAARGIPVWEGCAVNVWFYDGWVIDVVRHIQGPDGVFTGYRGGRTIALNLAIPQIADPDTRAAYDRRLALALGCPGACADVGVRFRLVSPSKPEHGWVVEAGHDEGDFYDGPAWTSEPATIAPGVTDPLLARALAWPADKRVTA